MDPTSDQNSYNDRRTNPNSDQNSDNNNLLDRNLLLDRLLYLYQLRTMRTNAAAPFTTPPRSTTPLYNTPSSIRNYNNPNTPTGSPLRYSESDNRNISTSLHNHLPEEVHVIFSEAILVILTHNATRLRQICSDDFGSRVMQRIVMGLKVREHQAWIISAMSRNTLIWTKSNNCNFVIKQCLDHFDPPIVKPLLVEIARNCLQIATHKYGCCILQNCILKAKRSILFDNGEVFNILVAELIVNAQSLSQHCYGDYVLQYLIELKMPQINKKIVEQLEENLVSLSMNKQASNVVETLLKRSGEENANRITNNLFVNNPRVLEILQDPFGNFVAQAALKASTGLVRIALYKLIGRFSAQLQSHLYGKNVLACKKSLSNKHK